MREPTGSCMTHTRTLVMASIVSAILVVACAQQRQQPSAAAAGGTATAGMMAGPMTDAEIAAILDVANRGEIEQAELARQRAQGEQVRNYATAMIAGHGAATRQQSQILEQRGITPQHNAMSEQLMDQSMQTQEILRNLRGREFDRAYMDAQLQQHEELLRMLDDQLIPNAQDPQFRAFLEQLRGDVAAHLANAQRIRGELAG